MPYINIDRAAAQIIPSGVGGVPRTSTGETLLSFRNDLKRELGTRADVSDPADLNNWINKAYKYVCSILTVKELFSELFFDAVPFQPMYLMPKEVAWIKKVSIEDAANYQTSGGIDLSPIDIDTYRKLPEDMNETGYPTAWFKEQDILVLYQTPREFDKTIHVTFKVRPNNLALDSDSPILAPEYHEAILLRAKHVAFRTLKAYNEAGIARNDFATDLGAVENNDAKEEGSGSVRPIFSARDLQRLRSND